MNTEAVRERKEYLMNVGTIFDAIKTSLFICDIERDKIPGALHGQLRSLVEGLAQDCVGMSLKKAIASTEKLSITRESEDTLFRVVMEDIDRQFREMGMEVVNIDIRAQLVQLVSDIITVEKHHRDSEVSFNKDTF